MPPASRSRAATAGSRPATLPFSVVAALGNAGGVVAYLPLMTLLLPLQVERVAGAARFDLLAAALIAGAVAAGAANILFGWLSDRTLARPPGRRRVGRRSWIAAGLAALLLSYAGLAHAATPTAIMAAVIAFQVALNAVLAPLLALIAEESSAARKGLIGGLFAAGPPLAAALCPLLVAFTPASTGIRLALVGATATACIVPLLARGPAALDPAAPDPAAPDPAAAAAPLPSPAVSASNRRNLALAWVARLLAQTAGNVLFAYLLYFMEGFATAGDRGAVTARVSALILLGSLLPLPVAVVLGRWADGRGRHRAVLAGAAAAAAAGLVVMAAARGWPAAALGFCLFSIGWGSFMPLQVGFVMQLLPDPRRRGRDLGIMNLANVLPVLVGQALAWLLAVPGDVSALLAMLAALTLAGGLVMLKVAEPAASASPGSR